MSDPILLKNVLNARAIEKKYTLQVLEYLEEIDKRKLYVELGCNSLFAYCTKILKYSNPAAAIRVNAMRLVKNEPTVRQHIKQGNLSLSSASQIQGFFKQEKPSGEIRKEIINQAQGQSKRGTQKILDTFSTNRSATIKITLKKNLIEKLRKVQEILKVEQDLEAIEIAMDQIIAKSNLHIKNRASKGSTNQRYIARAAKKAVMEAAGYQCQKCKGKTILQYDHIRPISKGGSSRPDNLQILCFACNQRKHITGQHKSLAFFD